MHYFDEFRDIYIIHFNNPPLFHCGLNFDLSGCEFGSQRREKPIMQTSSYKNVMMPVNFQKQQQQFSTICSSLYDDALHVTKKKEKILESAKKRSQKKNPIND